MAVQLTRPIFYGGPDPITLNKMSSLVTNVRTMQREGLAGISQVDPRRDLDDECGYPKNDLTSEEYRDLIDYEPVAAIVNEIYPLESWQAPPTLYEDEDAETETDFELAWDALPDSMGIEPSHHSEEEASILWQLFLQADVLTGYGRYGVMLLGLDDGKQLSEPVTPRKGMQLTYVRVFPEYLARIASFDMDINSRRYGYPLTYWICFADINSRSESQVNEPYQTLQVHWSRVIHITDTWHTACSSPVFGVPRCRPVRNPLLDIRKVRGSSAEMYYKGAFPGIHFGTHPSLGADVNVDSGELRDMYEEYINGLQRAIYTQGMTADALAPQVVDPSPQILVQIEAVCMKTRTPKRIFIGGEMGERSSEEDRKKWNGRLQSRQTLHNTPKMVTPLANRLINLGVLPTPKDGFRVTWPDIASLTEAEKSTILLTRTQAYSAYVTGGIESVIPPLEYMTKFDGMDEEEAQSIIDAAEANQEVLDEENQLLADEQGLLPEVEGFKEPTPDPIELEEAKAKAKIGGGK